MNNGISVIERSLLTAYFSDQNKHGPQRASKRPCWDDEGDSRP